MPLQDSKKLRLTDRDLKFLVETASPGVSDKTHLIRIIREDEDFRNSYISDEKVFRKLMDDDVVLIASEENSKFSEVLTVDEFNTSEQVAIKTGRPPNQSKLDNLLKGQGVNRNVAVWMSNFCTIPFFIANSDLLAVMPRSLANLYCGKIGVRMISPPFPLKGLTISMAWSAGVHNNLAHSWLRSRVAKAALERATPPEVDSSALLMDD